MDYARLLGDAFELTRRYRFLWVLGLFAGSSTCSPGLSTNFNVPSGTSFPNTLPRADDFGPGGQRFLEETVAWIQAHVGLLVGVGVVLLVLFVVLLVVHFIAEGAQISALARLAAGEPATLGTAWAAGQRLAWRYVRLWLLSLAVGLAIVVLIGLVVGLLFVVGQTAPTLAVALGVLLAPLGILVAIPVLIAVYVVLLYAQRAIAVDDLGVVDAVGRGIAMLRARLGPSLLLWLISLVVGIVAGIAAAIGLAIVLIPIVAAGVGFYVAFGASATMIVVAAVLVAFMVALLWLFAAVVNTYTAAYWTLGYLGLTERYPPVPAAD